MAPPHLPSEQTSVQAARPVAAVVHPSLSPRPSFIPSLPPWQEETGVGAQGVDGVEGDGVTTVEGDLQDPAPPAYGPATGALQTQAGDFVARMRSHGVHVDVGLLRDVLEGLEDEEFLEEMEG